MERCKFNDKDFIKRCESDTQADIIEAERLEV